MKRFRFKLQTLLDQRKAKEDRLQAELAEVRREEARESARLLRLERRLAEALSSMASALAEDQSVAEIARRDDYAKAVREDVKVQALTLEAVLKRVEMKREEVVDAMRDRKVLETLRDKQERAHIQRELRIEQNELDDTASVRYARSA